MARAHGKPLDVGTGRVCASFDPETAAWLSIGAPHARHGFIELSGMPAFDEAQRGNPTATRRYRELMTDVRSAFLRIELDGELPSLSPDAADPESPRWRAPTIDARAEGSPSSSTIQQHWTLIATGAPSVVLRLRGALGQPALAEITETDPPTPTPSSTSLVPMAGEVKVRAPALPGEATVTVRGAAVAWRVEDGEVLGVIIWPRPDEPMRFSVEVSLKSPGHDAAVGRARLADRPDPDPMVGRALAYIRGCTALAVAPDEVAILTDHRILPLSWTRDAYWQALALLAADGPGDRERVADHLRWLWRRCERPDGRWMRSHHADGRRKDLVFQADQQLYPLVELADYWRRAGELPRGVTWGREIARAWAAAEREIDPGLGLIASAENAADDPAAAPFITASQVLLWYAAHRIAELAEAVDLELDPATVRRTGERARAAFAAGGADSAVPWPHAVDASGTRVLYHDANDLPVAFAPLWGFCQASDAGWRATMRFAFGPDNPAWFNGDRSGLGSAHTPGPWTLGDIQAWVVARANGDAASMARSLRRLRSVAFLDAMLPEAYASHISGDRRIRHWFAWPGAALAALVLLDRQGRLDTRLQARPIG